MGISSSCFASDTAQPVNTADKQRIQELEEEVARLRQELRAAQADATSARKTLTVALNHSSPLIKASPTEATCSHEIEIHISNPPSPSEHATATNGSTAVKQDVGIEELKAQVLFLENQLHGTGPNTLSGLQQSNQRLVSQMDALNQRLLEARQMEKELYAEISSLQTQLRQQQAVNDATVGETNKLMEDYAALKASYTQLAGDVKLKDEMVGLLQEQLAELSEQLPELPASRMSEPGTGPQGDPALMSCMSLP